MRHLPFERGVNFRDLGGYETADGRRVRWRKLFRCGALDKLTPADLARIEDLHLALVCDFRGEDECVAAPSRLPTTLWPRVRQLEIVPGGSLSGGAQSARGRHFSPQDGMIALVTGRQTAAELSAVVHGIYAEIVIDFAPVYAEMFRYILDGEGRPTLIHCTGGKDRTGIGSALILAALGVPEETIVQDYMLSAESVPLRLWLNGQIDTVAKHHPLPCPREALLEEIIGIWGVSPDWLHAAIKAMDQAAGSVEGYLRKTLGITAADQERLRAWYLEAA